MTAEEGEWLKPPAMALMEDPADDGLGGVGGDGQGGVAAWMYKKGGHGDSILTWLTAVIISGLMVKSFLALDRKSVRGRAMWASWGRNQR